jgi:hypothetical protein
VAATARPSGRDSVMASPPPPRRRWLLEGAGAAFHHIFGTGQRQSRLIVLDTVFISGLAIEARPS